MWSFMSKYRTSRGKVIGNVQYFLCDGIALPFAAYTFLRRLLLYLPLKPVRQRSCLFSHVTASKKTFWDFTDDLLFVQFTNRPSKTRILCRVLSQPGLSQLHPRRLPSILHFYRTRGYVCIYMKLKLGLGEKRGC